LAASEVAGFAKTGGLADVAASLPRALARRGHHCAVILPLYRSARRASPEPTAHRFAITLDRHTVPGRLWRSRLPGSDVTAYLIEQPDYYERDDPAARRGLYQFTAPDGSKRDYPDNAERYIFFCRAVLEAMRLLGEWPEVLHANDWQTGLLPVYLCQARHPRSALPEGYARIRTLFTIHNLAYQGVFWHWDMALTGLSWNLFNYRQLEFHGQLNLLKAGIVFADAINTVSPTYAREIQTPYLGCGLQGVLAERRQQLFGIVNGIDYDVWNPATDPHLPAHYDAETVFENKPACKAALQRRLHLDEEPQTPLLGVVARLAEQKGIDLIIGAAPDLVAQGAQLAVLGEGDPAYQRALEELRARYPGRVGAVLALDEPLAHQIEGGADAFLMPSLYEPCGLNQFYSMRYGTVPVVRATGGLADTVVNCTPETLAADTATGFSFLPHTAAALTATVRQAVAMYRGQPEQWRQLVRCGMRQDWSWDHSAAEYEKLYTRLCGDSPDSR
jgi:starch synthase